MRIQPTLDSHGRVFLLSVSVCPESCAPAELYPPSMEEALGAAYFRSGHAYPLLGNSQSNHELLTYICRHSGERCTLYFHSA